MKFSAGEGKVSRGDVFVVACVVLSASCARTASARQAQGGQSGQSSTSQTDTSRGSAVGGRPNASQITPAAGVAGRSQLLGAARVTRPGPSALGLEQAI